MDTNATLEQDRALAERSALEALALRWAVLAGWAEQLGSRGLPVPPEAARKREEARIKISSGCFSSCEVGGILGDLEAGLISADGSAAESRVDFWLELLASASLDREYTERLLRIPAIRVQFNSCGVPNCRC